MQRTRWRLLSLAAALAAASGCASSYERAYGPHPFVTPSYGAPNGYDVWTFYEALEPYGRWFEYPGHGWAWTPHGVGADWRPYRYGYWVDSDFGWTWVANEPWGWAPYHYGRWIDDPGQGWVWLPGGEWAPAWVAWRHDSDWVGWAPLPPDALWSAGSGLEVDAGRIPPSRWSFVERRHFASRDLGRRMAAAARNGALIERTRDATRYEIRHGRPYNRGIDRTAIERLTGRPVPHVQVVDAETPPRGPSRVSGNRLALYRPTMRGDAATRRAEERRAAAVERQRRLEEQQRTEAVRRREQAAAQERARVAREDEGRRRSLAAERTRAAQAEQARERALATERARAVRAERALEPERSRAVERERELRLARQRALNAERAREARVRDFDRRRAAQRAQAAAAERREDADRAKAARAKKAREARERAARAGSDRRGS